MSGKSKHSSLVNRMAGCSVLNTVSNASDLGTHLNRLTGYITKSRYAVFDLTTLCGTHSLASPCASTGDCAAGVPVNIHTHVFAVISLAIVFHRFVVAVLYALASSIITKSNPPSFIASCMTFTPS